MTDRKNKGGSTGNETAQANLFSCDILANLGNEISQINIIIFWTVVITLIRSKRNQKRIIDVACALKLMDDVVGKRLIAIFKLCGV